MNNQIFSLVSQIHTVNHSWKLAQKMENNEHFLAIRLRDLKTRLQIKLLKKFATEYVYLQEDKETESDEKLYSLKLVSPIKNYHDAAHLPIRVVHNILSLEEIFTFTQL